MPQKNSDKKDELDEQLNEIDKLHETSDNMKQYLVDVDEDIPEFGEIDIYDYDADIEKSKGEADDIIKDLVDLYLGDSDHIIGHPYITKKMDEDAQYYSSMKFLEKMSRKLLLQQLKQIDSGDNSPRMHEIAAKTMGEIRENIKDGRLARTEIESMYKEMRKDFGLNELHDNNDYTPENNEDGEVDSNGETLSNTMLNERIDNILKTRK